MTSPAVNDFLQTLKDAKDAAKAKPKREWKPLLGQMLEYGDSGYVIVLQKDKKRAPFSLRDPEGRELGAGDNLGNLKGYAEQQAKFRDEFDMGSSSLSDMPDFKRFQTGN